MSNYLIETSEFGISEKGIHLLRNRFNFKTIPFNEITMIEIDRGPLISNWVITLLLASVMLLFGFYCLNGVIQAFISRSPARVVEIELIVLPILPLALGAYCLYLSLRRGMVMIVRQNQSRKSFPIHQLAKKSEIEKLVTILKSFNEIKNRIVVNVTIPS